MNLNLYPKINPQTPSPGTLALKLSTKKFSIIINTTSNLFNTIDTSPNIELIFGSLDSLNFSTLNSINDKLVKNTNFKVHAAKILSKWLEALIEEESQSSKKYNDSQISEYAIDTNEILISNDKIQIEYIYEYNDFSKYILKITFPQSELVCFYCEVAEITSDFPLCMKCADILFLNLVNMKIEEDYHLKLLKVLKDNDIKSAIFHTNEGIMLSLPQSKPIYRELIKKNTYEMNILDIKCELFYQKYSSMTKSTVLPITIENETAESCILLGLNYKSILNYQQALAEKYKSSAFILPASNYKNVLECVRLSEHIDKSINIICGKFLNAAVQSLRDSTVHNSLNKKSASEIEFTSVAPDAISRHIVGDFELVMIPYVNSSNSYISRIKDIQTGEFLIFTETIDDLQFLEKTLKGISSLVFTLSLNERESNDNIINLLQNLQAKNKIPRLIIMSPKETLFFDLDLE